MQAHQFVRLPSNSGESQTKRDDKSTSNKVTSALPSKKQERSATDLDDALHHAHHLVHDGNDFVRPLGRRHVGPVGRRQDVAAGHVQDVRGREFEVDCGAVGVVDDGRQEGVLGCRGGKPERQ